MTTIKQETMEDAITEADDENKLQLNAEQTSLEKFINIPGLQHLAENVFLNLNYRDHEACGLVKGSFQYFLDQHMANPLFWLEKFVRGEK